jgi:hypothetical protein
MLSFCSEIDFGVVPLSSDEIDFCREMDDEVTEFCNSLPPSMGTDAILFWTAFFRMPLGEQFCFFQNYYTPAWSIIYWLFNSTPVAENLSQQDIRDIKTAHAMALLLHPLDDHLNDGQIAPTHLAVLVRSHAWFLMNNAFNRIADGLENGKDIVHGFLADYYSSITGSREILSLESYCDTFRKQMATGFITPVLLMRKMSADDEFVLAIQDAYGSFGIAWRLLDDIKDLETDILNGSKSSFYYCLPDEWRITWDGDCEKGPGNRNHRVRLILSYVLENGLVEIMKERICHEVESAARLADAYNVRRLADEFRYLLGPLKTDETKHANPSAADISI